MDETTEVSSGPEWWQSTLDFVARAAAMKQFSSPKLSNGQSYYVDQNGNVMPTGQVIPGQINPAASAVLGNPLVMLAGLVFAGVILYKLVK